MAAVNPTLIYLDTNLWNALRDQGVDPQSLLGNLRGKNATLALSGQTVYELSRTFLSSVPYALARAQELFIDLKHYVDMGISCAHDNMLQLHGEVRALNTGASAVVAFYSPEEYASLQTEVEKLSQGIFDDRADEFIVGRRAFSESTRSDQKSHFDHKQHVRDQLTSVSHDQLAAWLDSEMPSDTGVAILARHLCRMYQDIPVETAILNAQALLHIPASRIAKGIVRADLYYNWRCANRGSNPKDLVDDLYHVLNSSYCSVYATAEAGQTEYAALMLSQWTRVTIYDGQLPVDEWLLSLT